MNVSDIRARLRHRSMRRRAGRRARDTYNAQRRAWLRENRKYFAGVAAVTVAIVVAFHLAVLWWPGDQAWGAGFVAGALGAALLLLRQTPPTIIEQWQEGAWGERFTADELVKIAGQNWTVLNDLSNGQYNFDHVVIGPAGVFCLNSKKSQRRLEVAPGGGRLKLTNRFDPSISYFDEQMLNQARRDAIQLRDRILERTGQRVWVHAVIVWWGEFPDRRHNHRDVGLVHGRELVSWLAHQPAKATIDTQRIAEAIRPGRRRKEASIVTWLAGHSRWKRPADS